MWEHQSERIDLKKLHRELSTRCRAAGEDILGIPDLTLFALRFEKQLNKLVFLEELLIPIERARTLETSDMEEYCKVIYRIIRRTNEDEGTYHPGFQTSVAMQLIQLMAERRGWPAGT